MIKAFIIASAIAVSLISANVHAADSQQSATFASDFQVVPVMANTRGLGGSTYQSYVALFNPTRASFPVEVTLYDQSGQSRDAMILLAAGEVKTYSNFLESVFNFSGGGAVTFSSPDSIGGTRNNRFIVSTEIRTGTMNRYSTTIPVLEIPPSATRAFSAGITVDSTARTNVGCFNQSGMANRVKATVFDSASQLAVGSLELNLAPHAWGQTGVSFIVSGGYVQFEPSEAAACYAVVVDNSTNDGRFISATEYAP